VVKGRSRLDPPVHRIGRWLPASLSAFPELPTPPRSASALSGFQPPVRFPRPAGSFLPVSS